MPSGGSPAVHARLQRSIDQNTEKKQEKQGSASSRRPGNALARHEEPEPVHAVAVEVEDAEAATGVGAAVPRGRVVVLLPARRSVQP